MSNKRRQFLRLLAALGAGTSLPGPVQRLLAAQTTGLVATPQVALKLRRGPGTDYTAIGLVPVSKVLPVMGRDAGAYWVNVDYAGRRGWIAAWLCEFNGTLRNAPVLPPEGSAADPAAATPEVDEAAGVVAATTNAVLRIRSGPGTSFAQVGRVLAGVRVPVHARGVDGQGRTWLRVTYAGINGWIAGWFCTIQGDLADVPAESGGGGETSPPADEPPADGGVRTIPAEGLRPAIVPRAGWGAIPVAADAYVAQTPMYVTVHHDGEYFGDHNDPIQRLQTTQSWSMGTRGWVDVPYHFLVDRQGVVYAGRPVTAMGDTGTNYNPLGHVSISILGNYGYQAVRRATYEAVVTVAAWLCAAYGIPTTRVHGHRHYAYTPCPGEIFYLDYLVTGKLVRDVNAKLGG